MNKYLIFILIGIILFILNNSINSFSIGIPEYQFTIEGEEINLSNVLDNGLMSVEDNPVYQDETLGENTIYVYGIDENDARRKLKRHIDLNTDDATLVDIRLTTPVIGVDQNDRTNVRCKPNYNCNLVNEFLSEGDECYPHCNDDDENCINYHKNERCIQNCSFVNVNISRNHEGTFTLDKTLENDGFQIFPGLVNVDSTRPIIFDQVYENNILYSEYIFKKFLERIYPGSNLHKISNSLYYINGKIILSRNTPGGKRSTINPIFSQSWQELTEVQQIAATTLGWNEDTWYYSEDPRRTRFRDLFGRQKAAVYTLGWDDINWYKLSPYDISLATAFPKLHMDFQKYITYESREDEVGNYGNVSRDGMNRCIKGQNSKFNYVTNYTEGIYFISNNKSKSINLWLLLYGSPNIKTMGFIDIIDDDDSDKYNADTLRDMQANDLAIQQDERGNYSMVSFPDRLTPYFQLNSVQYPNVLEIETSDTTLLRSKPNINPNILYTYDMIQGDVLAFRTDIPHIGFTDYDRTSVEFRYDYIEINLEPFDELFLFTTNQCSVGNILYIETNQNRLQDLLSEFLLNPEDARLDYTSNSIYQAIIRIQNFMSTIFTKLKGKYKELKKEELLDPSIFYRFLEFLNTKPTLNLQKNIKFGEILLSTNNDYDQNVRILIEYIEDFINSL